MGSVITPPPIPIPVPADPSWTEVAGFWVSALGAVANTAIAVVAIVLTVGAARAASRREARAGRAQWAHEYSVWLDAGTIYLAAGMEAAMLTDREWIDRGNDIQTRARLLDSEGADRYMVAARAAFEDIATKPPELRITAAMTATKMLSFWVEGWVNDPKKAPGDIGDWLKYLRGPDANAEPADEADAAAERA